MATNAGGIECEGDYSCELSAIDVVCNNNTGCILGCESPYSCNSSMINAQYISQINCKHDYSCYESMLNIIGLNTPTFFIECANYSCVDANINVVFDDPDLSVIKGIKCGSFVDEYACNGAMINITSLYNPIMIDKIECQGDYACLDTTIILTNVIAKETVCHGTSENCAGFTVINQTLAELVPI